MRVKPELAAVAILVSFGVALAVGLLAGVAVTKATAAEPPTIHCPCPRATITT